jgi:hypothetical protein
LSSVCSRSSHDKTVFDDSQIVGILMVSTDNAPERNVILADLFTSESAAQFLKRSRCARGYRIKMGQPSKYRSIEFWAAIA